jgi:phosphomevalonate kinase
LAGRRRTGKSTTASLIVALGEEMEVHIRRVSFADPLREMFSKETGISMRHLLSVETKEAYRDRLIAFAQEKQKHNPRVLINALFADITVKEDIVIDDMRTIEELEAVIKVGGKPYKIVASQKVRESRGYQYNSVIDNALLETEMDLAAHTYMVLGGGQIFNNGTEAYLRNQLFDIVRQEYKKKEVEMVV